VNDPSGENEISGTSLIRICMAAGLTAPVTFQMNCTTAGETWQVQGSDLPTSGFAPLLTGMDELLHSIPFFNFYTFQALSGNVLLGFITAVPGPIVGAGLPVPDSCLRRPYRSRATPPSADGLTRKYVCASVPAAAASTLCFGRPRGGQ
jgi:hypothetical protein